MRTHTKALLALTLAMALLVTACGGDDSASSGDTTGGGGAKLSLVGFSVPKPAHDAAQKAFAETDSGKGDTFTSSYGASGDQSRAVADGLDADVVHFSLEGDVTRLVDAGLVADDWNSGPTKGIASSSVVVLVVRKGNPKGITGW